MLSIYFRNLFITVFLFLFLPKILFGQDQILGKWLTASKRAHIEIFKQGDKYYGKIVWIRDPVDPETNKPWLDKFNPDKSIRTKPVMEMVILKNFNYYKNDREFRDGTLYDPRKGVTYKGKMWLSDNNTLRMRGYVLIFFYETEKWTRVP